QCFCKCSFRPRTVHFSKTSAPVFISNFLKTWPTQSFTKLPQMKSGLCIAFSPESQDGIGTCLNTTSNHPREMDSKKGEVRIGNRINQVFNKMFFFFRQLIIFPTKRDDFKIDMRQGYFGQFVRI